jgi:hypothetical protein
MTRSLLLVATALLVLSAGTTALSSGAFTATSANSVSSFSADANFPSACTAGSVSAVADSDATIRSTGAAPSGNAVTLTVGTSTTGGTDALFRALVHFPMPTIPSGCSLDSATLRMTNSSAVTGRTIDVHEATGSWTESTVWPGPSFGGALAGVAAANGTLSWTVTTAAAAIYAGATNNGFLIKDRTDPTITQNGNRTQTFASSESGDAAQRPVLVVSYE